jgi:hypothetical protein
MAKKTPQGKRGRSEIRDIKGELSDADAGQATGGALRHAILNPNVGGISSERIIGGGVGGIGKPNVAPTTW